MACRCGIKDIIDIAGLPTTCHSKILRRQYCARGRARDRPPARGRRDSARQTVAARIRVRRPVEGLAVSVRAQSLERGSPARRLILGLGRGAGRGLRAACARHRHRRIDPQSRGLLRRRGVEADLRPRVAPRRISALLHARPRRADGALGRRRRIAARRARPATCRGRPVRRRSRRAARAACASASCATSTRATWRPIRKSPQRSTRLRVCSSGKAPRCARSSCRGCKRLAAVQRVILLVGSLGGACQMDARAARRLRRAHATQGPERRVLHRRRLCAGAAMARTR